MAEDTERKTEALAAHECELATGGSVSCEERLHFQPHFFTDEESTHWKEVLSELKFPPRSALKVAGNAITRKELFFAEQLEDGSMPVYRYPGDKPPAVPDRWPVALEPLVLKVREFAKARGQDVNHLVLVQYENGDDRINPHYDKYDDFRDGNGVFCVSFGQSRELFIQRMEDGYEQTLRTGNGSLYHIDWKTNQTFMHGVTPDQTTEPRWALTFRCIDSRVFPDGTVVDKHGKRLESLEAFKDEKNPKKGGAFHTPEHFMTWREQYNPYIKNPLRFAPLKRNDVNS